MADTPESHSSQTQRLPKPRRGRAFRRVLMGVACLAAMLLAAVAWLTTGSGLRWLTARPFQLGSIHVEIQGVRGSLWGELHIGRVQVQYANADVDAHGVQLRWRPAALLRRPALLDVQQADCTQLRVTWQPRPGSASTTLPQSLALPLRVEVARLHIGSLSVGSPGSLEEVGDVLASLRIHAGGLETHARISAPWGELRGHMALGTKRPFPISGSLGGTLHVRGAPIHLTAEPSGDLEALRLRATATAFDARAALDGRLQPFSDLPLQAARLRIVAADPARIVSGAPSALLDVQLDLAPSGTRDVQGFLQVRNARAASLDRGGLPLERVQGYVRLQPGHLSIEDLRAALLGGGKLKGRGQWELGAQQPWRQARFSFDVQAQALNLHALESRLFATRLSGPLRVAGTPSSQSLAARLAQPGWLAELRAEHAADQITVDSLRLQAGTSRLSGHGLLSLAPPRSFQVNAELAHFDPSRFGKYPAADLNLQVTARGSALARTAQVDLRVRPSRWRGHVFSGQASGLASATGVQRLKASLVLGSNRLEAQGAFGAPGATLAWTLDAPVLAQIDPALQGQIRGSGMVSGTFAQPSGKFTLHAARLVAPGNVRVETLDARGGVQAGPQGALELQIEGQGIRAGRLALRAVRAQAGGRLDAQHIEMHAQGTDIDLRAQLTGGYTAARGWHGSIVQLANAGHYAARLLAPARLVLAPGEIALRGARLQSGGGFVDLQDLRWSGGKLVTRGSANGVNPAFWWQTAGLSLQGVRSSVRLQASWDIAAGSSLTGHVDIARTEGDVNLPTEPRLNLGLSVLHIQLIAEDDRIQANVDAAGSVLGSVRGTLQTRVARHGNAWGVEGAAPLAAKLSAELPSIAWAAPLVGPMATLGGELQLTVQATGQVGSPQLSGRMSARDLAVALPDEGLDLRQGQLEAIFTGDRIELRRFEIRGGQGDLTAGGTLRLGQGTPQGDLQFAAKSLQVLNRADRQAVVSGKGTVTLRGRVVRLDGSMLVDRASIELPRGSAPKLASDVVIEGRAPQRAQRSAPAAPYAVSASLRVDLGRHTHVSGYGLDAQLGGVLTLRANSAEPLTAYGSIEVHEGTYSAYGQSLQLTKGGALNFSGPVDNPGLNFAAQRTGLPVTVGVQVTGTLRAPLVALTSTPAMPDSEILSWLVLGQDLSTASPNNMALLQTAAGALLASGQGAPVTSRVASALGLSQLSFSGQSGLQNSIVTLGKRISSRLSVGVEQGLGTAGSVFNIRYEFSHRLSLRLQSGAQSAVDMFYTFRFD